MVDKEVIKFFYKIMNDKGFDYFCLNIKASMCDLFLKIIDDFTLFDNHFEVCGTDLVYDFSDNERRLFELYLAICNFNKEV